MKLYLTRHGETVDNINRTLQGQSPGQLTQEGIDQAKRLAESLKDKHFDLIYSSDLKRAADTAKEIARFHPDIPHIELKRLRERDFKDYVGKPYEAVDFGTLPEGVETNKEMRKRIKSALDEIHDKDPDKTVMVVVHGGVIKVILSIIYGTPVDEIEGMEKHGNTALSIIEFTEDKNHIIHLLNNQDHLE